MRIPNVNKFLVKLNSTITILTTSRFHYLCRVVW